MNLNKFIARRDNKIFYCSNEIGVKPILSKLNENIDFYKDADIEDTVVGKAAACLYVLAKIKYVYAHTLSETAKIYLENNNILKREKQKKGCFRIILGRASPPSVPRENLLKSTDSCVE